MTTAFTSRRGVLPLGFAWLLALAVLVSGCVAGPSVEVGEEVVIPVVDTVADQPGIDLHRLPIGDGRVSAGPEVDSVWACRQTFQQRNIHNGPWINDDGTFDLLKRVIVPGEERWPSEFLVATQADRRTVTGNALPAHPTGAFPAPRSGEAFALDPNPNTIQPQTFTVDLPRVPAPAPNAACLPMGPIGVLLSGAAFYNALDAAGLDAVAHEVRDRCDGHPQGAGHYHYHNLTTCVEDGGQGHSALLGYAFDGFGLFGVRGTDGKALTNAGLDECHGHTHQLDWDGQRTELYHYHATAEYPYLLGRFRGATRFEAPPGGGGQRPRQRG